MRIIYLCCLLFFTISSCKSEPPPSSHPIVLVSIPSYLYFVKRIAGDTVTALSLVPPGANPHVFEPTPKEVLQLRKAALWMRLGELSDQKTYTVLKEQSPMMRIIDMTETIALLPVYEKQSGVGKTHCCSDHKEGKDLHIWLSPKLAQQQAKIIAHNLSELLPQNKEKYDQALTRLLSDLQSLDREITSLLSSKNKAAILTSHPAFAYFCQDYHLTQFSIEIEGKDPLPQDITHILKMVKEHKITTILVEPQYSNKGAHLIAEQLGLSLYSIDPYSEDYLKNLRWIAEVIAK